MIDNAAIGYITHPPFNISDNKFNCSGTTAFATSGRA